MLATRGGSRTPGLYHNSDRSVGSADQPSLLNPRFEPSMATRGRRPPQHASSEQVVDRRECGRPPGGLAHQSSELARHFGKSPRNFMPRSETVCANLGICILSHLLDHSLYTVLHLKHLNFGLYKKTPKFTRGSRGREQTARPSGAVIELRHEEGAGHNGLGQR